MTPATTKLGSAQEALQETQSGLLDAGEELLLFDLDHAASYLTTARESLEASRYETAMRLTAHLVTDLRRIERDLRENRGSQDHLSDRLRAAIQLISVARQDVGKQWLETQEAMMGTA